MNIKHDEWLVKKLVYLYSGKPRKKIYDLPDANEVSKSSLFDFDDELLFCKWDEEGPYREEIMYHSDGYNFNGKYAINETPRSSTHKVRIHTWKYPAKPLVVPENLVNVIELPGNLVVMTSCGYSYVNSEYPHGMCDRRTGRKLPETLHRSYGDYGRADPKYSWLDAGTLLIACGMTLTNKANRPDLYEVISPVGRLCLTDLSFVKAV